MSESQSFSSGTSVVLFRTNNYPESGPAYTKLGGYFFSGLVYGPHVSVENGHRKRILLKMLSRLEIFENFGFSFTCGRTKTIRIRYIKMLIFLKTEKKVSIFKNIRICVEGASGREKKFICMKFCSRCLRCKLNTARGEERWRCFCAFGGWKATSCYC